MLSWSRDHAFNSQTGWCSLFLSEILHLTSLRYYFDRQLTCSAPSNYAGSVDLMEGVIGTNFDPYKHDICPRCSARRCRTVFLRLQKTLTISFFTYYGLTMRVHLSRFTYCSSPSPTAVCYLNLRWLLRGVLFCIYKE